MLNDSFKPSPESRAKSPEPNTVSSPFDKLRTGQLSALSLPKVTWGPVAAILVTLGAFFGGQLLGGVLVSLVPLIMGQQAYQVQTWFTNSSTAQFLLILAVEAVTLALLYVFLRSRKATLRTLGLIKPKLRDAGYAIVGFVIYFPLYIAVASAISSFVPSLNVDQKQQLGFEQVNGNLELALVFISLTILPPLVEEILVRGFLYSGLKTKLSPLIAGLGASFLFASAHLQFGSGEPLLWVAAIDTFVLSTVLIYLREKTDGLWASIGLHAIKNSLAFTVLFVIPRYFPNLF